MIDQQEAFSEFWAMSQTADRAEANLARQGRTAPARPAMDPQGDLVEILGMMRIHLATLSDLTGENLRLSLPAGPVASAHPTEHVYAEGERSQIKPFGRRNLTTECREAAKSRPQGWKIRVTAIGLLGLLWFSSAQAQVTNAGNTPLQISNPQPPTVGVYQIIPNGASGFPTNFVAAGQTTNYVNQGAATATAMAPLLLNVSDYDYVGLGMKLAPSATASGSNCMLSFAYSTDGTTNNFETVPRTWTVAVAGSGQNDFFTNLDVHGVGWLSISNFVNGTTVTISNALNYRLKISKIGAVPATR